MNKKRLIISSVVSIFLATVLLLGSTYSIFTTSEISDETNVYTTGNLDVTYTLNEGNIVLSDSTPMSDDDSCWIVPYEIVVTNVGTVPYKFDLILNDTTAANVISYQYIKVQVGRLEIKTLNEFTDNIIKEDIIVSPGDSVSIEVRVWLSDTILNSEIGKSFYAKLSIDGLAVYDDNDINNDYLIANRCYNEPNLDDDNLTTVSFSDSATVMLLSTTTNNSAGNLIPVYYDEQEEVWKKADRTNENNDWYDYENRMWANAVVIGDEEKKSTYQQASVGTTIMDDDITAFYVWIPRFKYRVWNITRQAGTEDTYSYSAYTNGIDIEWEQGNNSTGNVQCVYDVSVEESETNLSDVCVYDGTDVITTTSGNANYKSAWYTHPAFVFGDRELEGFWVGKFEVGTNASGEPVILPDRQSLTSQNVSTQFTTSKVFQNYLSDNVDAHMLTSLEWGAVVYLTHSIYGLCSDTGCRDVYINNSKSMYTGRSGGAIAGSSELQLVNFYGSDVTTLTTEYNDNGYYNYKGYMIDNDGNVTSKKDITKVASTTGNITGVYDLSGGAIEYVMGNMVNSDNEFFNSASGSSWNGADTLDDKYYSSYSYGSTSYDKQAFNRARLGDATAEVATSNSRAFSSWKPPSGNTSSQFVNSNNPWVNRGCYYSSSSAGMFYFGTENGVSSGFNSFRSSIS